MDSIIITPKTEQEYSLLMEMLKKMRIKAFSLDEKVVKQITKDKTEVEIAPSFPTMAQEELDERIQKSINGPTASSETVAKYFAKWKSEE